MKNLFIGIIFLAAAFGLIACKQPMFPVEKPVTPQLESYTQEELIEIFKEKSTLPADSIIRTKVLLDWERMRADIKASKGDNYGD